MLAVIGTIPLTAVLAIVQFTDTDENGEHKIFFTGSAVVMEQLEKYEEELPFQTTLKKIDKYLTLS